MITMEESIFQNLRLLTVPSGDPQPGNFKVKESQNMCRRYKRIELYIQDGKSGIINNKNSDTHLGKSIW
jgi:hypothetical protein